MPLGSLIGPLLFGIFVNDILFTLEDKCDGNTLSKCHTDPHVVKFSLEESAYIPIRSFSCSLMQANPEKNQCLFLNI